VSEAKRAPSGATAVGATRRLAQFASSLSFAQLPREVVSKAKLSILHTLGCCIFGASLPPVKKLAAMAEAEGCAQSASVFGMPFRTSAALAALVNGASAHAFQLDEIHLESTLHPGSLALPASFALAEADRTVGGRDLITAMVAADEVGIRVGLAAKGGMFKTGFHNQGTTGVFVAAAAAARILRLDAHQTQHALGIAGSQAAGLMAVQDGAMTKSFHSGRAAQSGVYAAQLARLGYTGIPDVLEAPYGAFFSSFVDEWSEPALTAGLGTQWHTLRIGFKPAPAANGSITAMTAIDTIMREHGLAASDIETITAYVSDNTLHHCGWPYDPDRIQSVLSAQMSLRFGVAVMALERRNGVAQFHESKIRDPEILKFIARIHVEHEPKFEGNDGKYRVACRLVVRCRNGTTHETTVLYRKGSPEDPMTEEQLNEKFCTLTERVGGRRSGQIADLVSHIEDCENLAELSHLLTIDESTYQPRAGFNPGAPVRSP
jgi:2-methylcitrate dehydratase PrpD